MCVFLSIFGVVSSNSLHAGFVDGNVRQKGSIDDFSIACTTEGKIEPAELVHTLLTPDARFRHIAEDGALGRIYRAYKNVSDEHWVIIYVVSRSLTC